MLLEILVTARDEIDAALVRTFIACVSVSMSVCSSKVEMDHFIEPGIGASDLKERTPLSQATSSTALLSLFDSERIATVI